MKTFIKFLGLIACFLVLDTLFLGMVVTCGWAGEDRVILLDCSGSVMMGPRSPFQSNLDVVRKAILTTPKDSQLYVLGFGKSTPVPFLTARTPKIAGPQGKNLKSSVEAAFRVFELNLKQRRSEVNSSGTDIEGTLFRVARIFAESSTGANRVLYIASDMQQESEEKKFTLRRMATYRSQLKKTSSGSLPPGSVPDLRGVKVHVFSQFSDAKGMSTKSIEQAVQALREYWTGYLKGAGAEVVSYKTTNY